MSLSAVAKKIGGLLRQPQMRLLDMIMVWYMYMDKRWLHPLLLPQMLLQKSANQQSSDDSKLPTHK
jgi:hypothetical protein